MKDSYLKTFYLETVVPQLLKDLNYKNKHQVPCVEKVVINSGINSNSDKNRVEQVRKEVTLIAGQHAVLTKAKISISNFKLREGMPVGAKVTLRGDRMYDFLYRFMSVAMPAIRDFRGISDKFDGQGNYSIGIQDHTIFPEVTVDPSKANIGLDICIKTSANSNKEGLALLTLLGFPFRKKSKSSAA